MSKHRKERHKATKKHLFAYWVYITKLVMIDLSKSFIRRFRQKGKNARRSKTTKTPFTMCDKNTDKQAGEKRPGYFDCCSC